MCEGDYMERRFGLDAFQVMPEDYLDKKDKLDKLYK